MGEGGWIRESGRADYRGYGVRVITTNTVAPNAEVVYGHPLLDCLSFWLAWKLGFLRRTRWGDILSLEIVVKDGPVPGGIRPWRLFSATLPQGRDG